MEIDGYIPIDKAVKWLQNKVYGGFDSMCLDFGTKDECIEIFLNGMKDPDTRRLRMIDTPMNFKNC